MNRISDEIELVKESKVEEMRVHTSREEVNNSPTGGSRVSRHLGGPVDECNVWIIV